MIPFVVNVLDFEVAKQNAAWGTYGKGGMEHCKGTCPEHQLRYRKLIDCETEHLMAILDNCPHILGSDYELIRSILDDRTVDGTLAPKLLGA